MTGRTADEARDDEALRLFVGLNYLEIAERLGTTRATVIRAVNRARARSDAPTEDRDAEALRLRETGLPYRQIARKFGWKAPGSAKVACERARAKQAGSGSDDRRADLDSVNISVLDDDDEPEASISVLGDPVYEKALREPFYDRNPDLRVCLEPIPDDLPEACRCEYAEYEPYDCDHGPPMSMRLSHQLRAQLNSDGRRILDRFEDAQHELMSCHREDAEAHVLSQIKHVCQAEPERASEPSSEPSSGRPSLSLVGNGPAPVANRSSLTDAELIDRYVQHMRRRNLSPGTITNWAKRLRNLSKLSGPSTVATMTRADLQAHLDTRNLSARTRYAWLSCLHLFYAWAIDEELLDHDPTAKITRPKITKTLPRPMPDEDLALAIARADPMVKCWLVLGAYQGLRCQEIAGIAREDIIEASMMLRVVFGKGQKQRMVPLHPEVLEALQRLPMPASGPVFRLKSGAGYQAPNVSLKLNIFLHELGISSTAHSLRHWFATSLYAETLDIRLTQEMMGHASPETTAIYTKADSTKSGPAVRALHVVDIMPVPPSAAQLEREAAAQREATAAAWRLEPVPAFDTGAARDNEALRLCELHFTYRQIAERLGWASHNSALEAVRRARANEPPDETGIEPEED